MLENIKQKIKNFSTGVKKSTADTLFRPETHMSSYLPENSGYFSGLIRNFIFRGIEVRSEDLEKIKAMDKDGIIVYASKYRCHFSYLLCYTRFRKDQIPAPTLGIDHSVMLWQPISHLFKILYYNTNHFVRKFALPDPFGNGHIREQLLDGKTAFLPLIGKKSFYRRFVKSETDPIGYLIEMQKTIDRPIYIVPELTFFCLNPQKSKLSFIDMIFGTKDRPGRLRKFAGIFKKPNTCFIELSAPLNLKTHLELPEIARLTSIEQATSVRSDLINQLNKHRQSVTGPILKSREEIKEALLTSDTMQAFMKNHAEENEIPMPKVHKQADEYIEEIAANYSPKWIRAYEIVLDWLFKTLFEGINVDMKGLSRVKAKSKDAPMIFVPCHKSHLDYLILSYMFKKHHMPCPHIAAGKNLSFWPLGTIFRGGGAFFMRRTFKGAELYAEIFSEYMKKLLTEGFNIELFIEGGRSRTGKLLPPKFGLLSILLEAYKQGACKNLQFVPVYFGYDRVLEEDSYLHEVEGGAKKPESVGQILKARKFLKKRYGKVYVNFHEPISLNDYIEETNTDYLNLDKPQQTEFCSSLGYKIINSINDVSIATPYGIVAGSILNNSQKMVTYERLVEDVNLYMNYLESQSTWLSDTLVQNRVRSIDSVLNNYIRRKFIECNSECENGFKPEMTFRIISAKRPVLDYYKNNSINFFVSASYTALAILELEEFQFESPALKETHNFLQHLFDDEFSYDRETSIDQLIRKDIKAFIDDGILTPHESKPDTYDLTATGYKKLVLFARFLKCYLESYLIIINTLEKHAPKALDRKPLLKKAQAMGKRMFKNSEIELSEALSDINYKNGIKFFVNDGLNHKDAGTKINYYKDILTNHLNQMVS